MLTVANIMTWAVIGLIAGSLAGALVKRQKAGFGLWQNIALGFCGAIIGGLLFGLFNIWQGLASVAISLRDVVAAVVGSLILLVALWAWNARRP